MNAHDDHAQARKLPPITKFALDFGPLLVFLVANTRYGIRWGTGAFMIASVLAIAYSWKVERTVSPMAWVIFAFVVVFGGLTVWLDSELFIKIKATVVEVLIGLTLLVGLAFRRYFVKDLLGSAMQLDDAGWRKFTMRFALFSFALAGANEIARAQLSTDHWVWFKVGGVTIATIVFMLTQTPLFKQHALPESGDSNAA